MSRSMLAGAAAIAAVALVPPMPALAQQDAGSSITVSAPAARPDSRGAGQPLNSARPRMRLVADVIVATADLDLRTAYGRNQLDSRIRLAADAACDRLDEIDPPGGAGGWNPDSGDCRHLAVKRAQPQRWAAVRAAG